MKSMFTLLLATLLTSAAFANDEGRLSITVATGSDVQVVIDNRSYRTEDKALTLHQIRPGNYTIRVYRSRRDVRDTRDRRPARANDRILGGGNRNDLLYSATVYVHANHHLDIMINRFGKALVDERPLYDAYDPNRDEDDKDWDRGQNSGYRNAISAAEFDRFVQNVRGQWLTNSKLTTAREGIRRDYFTTDQVRTLLQLFNSDTDKLELARLAYARTVDARNYDQLYSVFAYQSSREQLERYIRENR